MDGSIASSGNIHVTGLPNLCKPFVCFECSSKYPLRSIIPTSYSQVKQGCKKKVQWIKKTNKQTRYSKFLQFDTCMQTNFLRKVFDIERHSPKFYREDSTVTLTIGRNCSVLLCHNSCSRVIDLLERKLGRLRLNFTF